MNATLLLIMPREFNPEDWWGEDDDDKDETNVETALIVN